jgi:hypothetical protein
MRTALVADSSPVSSVSAAAVIGAQNPAGRGQAASASPQVASRSVTY